MSSQEFEPALDALVQQTWKRARTTQEIGTFVTRLWNDRAPALNAVDDEELDFELAA